MFHLLTGLKCKQVKSKNHLVLCPIISSFPITLLYEDKAVRALEMASGQIKIKDERQHCTQLCYCIHGSINRASRTQHDE